MAFCANCGNKVGDNDKFCASCGAARVPGEPASQQAPPPPPVYAATPPPPPVMPPPDFNTSAGSYQQSARPPIGETGGDSSTGLKPNVAALICYFGVWISGIIFLVLEKKNKFVRFHAAQSLVTFGALFVLGIILGAIPSIWFLSGLLGLLGFVLWIVLMVKSYQGEWYKLPIAGDIAEGIVGK